jgi:hypothetical protein
LAGDNEGRHPALATSGFTEGNEGRDVDPVDDQFSMDGTSLCDMLSLATWRSTRAPAW